MSRGILQIEEIDHDLTHLDPFTINVTPKVAGANTYKVLVSFGHHTFTKAIAEGDNLAYRYTEGTDERCICPDRLLASKGLPALVTQSAGGKAYFSQSYNYMLIDQPLGGPPYVVFFNLEANKAIKGVHASMFVISAYEKPALPSRSSLPAISFGTLVHKTVRGEKVVRPKK